MKGCGTKAREPKIALPIEFNDFIMKDLNDVVCVCDLYKIKHLESLLKKKFLFLG